MRNTLPKTLRATASTLALLTLWSCATAQPVAPAASNPTPAVPAEADAAVTMPAPAFTGLWYVSGVFPTAAARASIADPHLGAALLIDDKEVSDINGQRCVAPTFQADKTSAQGLGLKAAPVGDWDRLQVSCNGKAFATYILVPAKSGLGMAATAPKQALLQQRPEALYLLEQAEEILYRTPGDLLKTPVAISGAAAPKLEAAPPESAHVKEAGKAEAAPVEPAPKAAPTPVPEGPVAAQPEPAAKTAAEPAAKASVPHVTATSDTKIPAPGTAMHLASYKGESAAKRGWKILLGEYDELDPLSPLYVAVDVPGKGAIIRLYATGEDEAGLAKICAALQAKKVYCALKP